MNTPAILFGTILASFLGTVFHFVTGGGLGRLLLFLSASIAGFWLGQYIADRLNWDLLSFGALHLDLAICGALVLLLAAFWLTHTAPVQKR
jgi:hypothetical protein